MFHVNVLYLILSMHKDTYNHGIKNKLNLDLLFRLSSRFNFNMAKNVDKHENINIQTTHTN